MDRLCCKVCSLQLPVMKRCTRCRVIIYCSRDCQKKDWPVHKLNCKSQTQQQTVNSKSACYTINDSSIFAHKDASTKTELENGAISHPPLVDFTKAIKKEKSPYVKPEEKCYLHHNKYHTDVPDYTQDEQTCTITVKCNKERHKLLVQCTWNGVELFKFLSYSLNVAYEKMKLIHKGKVLTSDSVCETVKQGSVYQMLGEVLQSEENVDQRDITVMMEQTGLDRNAAVLALKKKGDLLDAMLDI